MIYKVNNFSTECPVVLYEYINLNYEWGRKIHAVVSYTDTNTTDFYLFEPLLQTEIDQLNNLLNVFNCQMNFVDPNISPTDMRIPIQDTIIDGLGIIHKYHFYYLSPYKGAKWLYTVHNVYSSYMPYTIPYDGKIQYVIFTCDTLKKEDSSYRNIIIHKRNFGDTSWQILATLHVGNYDKKLFHVDTLGNMTINAGNEIAVNVSTNDTISCVKVDIGIIYTNYSETTMVANE